MLGDVWSREGLPAAGGLGWPVMRVHNKWDYFISTLIFKSILGNDLNNVS